MSTIKDDIKRLQSNNDWIGIYNKVKPIEELKKDESKWNDDDLLNMISYATAKLSETSINLKWSFQDENEKRKFLDQQKQYRQYTNTLRQRCIDLKPNNASYYSNLAYSHYQYFRELTMPGGRRDGKPREEADKALLNFDKALEINGSRINDLQRKGLMLTEMLPKVLIYNRTSMEDKEKAKEANLEAKEKIEEGIKTFEKAVATYETYSPENQNRQRYYKNYVKTLYELSRAYADLIGKDWDETVFALKLNENISPTDIVKYIPKDLEIVEKSIINLRKCIINDNIPAVTNKKERLIDVAKHNGQFDGVYKLYNLGKILFLKYWILSGYGQRTNENADSCREMAIEYLKEALEFKWSQEKEKQDKSFIAERLARVYITKKEFDNSIQVLEKFFNQRKKPDYYVFYTLSIAYINKGEHDKAKRILNEAIENRGNKELWLGHFLMACSDLIIGNYDMADQGLEKAQEIAERNGKYNIDSLLIARSFISYKEHDKGNAIKFLEEADKLNPYRTSVKNYLERWKK